LSPQLISKKQIAWLLLFSEIRYHGFQMSLKFQAQEREVAQIYPTGLQAFHHVLASTSSTLMCIP
jgi:hypothetical protein